MNKPETICILRLSAIGDVCHAVAAVQAIQRRWPEAKVTWVIGKVEYQLLKGLEGVEFVCFDKKAGLKGYLALRSKLKNRTFDILLHMQVALRASLATLCIRAHEKWGFDKKRAKEGQWLFTNRKVATQKTPHVAEGFWGFAQAIGVEEEYPASWQMPIEEQDVLWWKENHETTLDKYIVIAPAASKAERNWLPERYAAIANEANKKGFSVVICGGPTNAEKQLADKIIANCDFEPLNIVAQTSLKQLLIVLQNASLVIAPDTGPAHMAVVVGTPVIGLYAHSNPGRTGPYGYQQYVASCYESLLIERTGKGISENRWGKRVKGDNLMSLISIEAVREKFEQVLTDNNLT